MSVFYSGVIPGGAGGANWLTRGTNYAHLITYGTSRFSDLLTALF
jgi:hypothetical protein